MSTDGVEMHYSAWEEATVVVWDYAGQPIYHTTHQYFLNARCMYVLVWNVQEGDAGVNR